MKKLYGILAVIMLLALVFGSAYAFFLFRQTGGNNILTGGSFYVDFTPASNLSLSFTNVFPTASFNVRNNNNNNNTLTFYLTGQNDTESILDYSIIINNGADIQGKTRFNATSLRFDLIRVENGEDIYVARNRKFNTLNDSVIYTRSLYHEDGALSEEYKLRVWISDQVVISDTLVGDDVYTTADYPNRYASVSVSLAVTNNLEGEKKKNYMNEFPTFVSTYKADITEVYFRELTNSAMEEYTDATVKEILSYQNQGSVYFWIIDSSSDTGKYIFNIASDGVTYLTTGDSLFDSFSSLKTIIFGNVNTSKVTSMYMMFNGCAYLTSLDLRSFDTKNVTTMEQMFASNNRLAYLDITSFDTSKVTTMQGMFKSCLQLTENNLKILNFSTSNVTTMHDMFFNCLHITSLDLSMFDVREVTSIKGMFYNMSRLTSINFDGWETNAIENFQGTFQICSVLTELDLSTFDTSSVTNTKDMFRNCPLLTTIYVSMSWDISGASISSASMFLDDTALIGGQGTVYDSNHVDKEYAIIDNPSSEPGYLTYKEVI